MTIMANTSKTWMKPPSVTEVTKPSSHKTPRMTAMVISMLSFPRQRAPGPPLLLTE